MNNVMNISIVLAIILLVLSGPIFTIMSINVLFGTGIELTVWTWLSTLWLHLLLVSRYTNTKK